MPSVLKFINLLVTGVSLGLVCPTSGCEVFGNVSAASPDVWETSTSWQQSTPNSVLFFTNSTNEFVVDEACHMQELSSVKMYNSLSSLEDPKIVFFKQGTMSGTDIKESRRFHWMHHDVQNTSRHPTPNSLLTNNTNEFVVDEACHTQKLSSVNMYNSLSLSLEDPKIVFFKQGTISGTDIKERFHWIHYDVQNTILISAGLCLCTAILFGFVSWIRPASQPPCSNFQTKQIGHQDHPRIARY